MSFLVSISTMSLPMNRTLTVFFSYLVLSLVLYGMNLFGPFVYDDVTLIETNQFLRWDLIPNFFRSFIPDSNFAAVGYRPLVFTLFTIEKGLFGLLPWVFR